MARLPYPTSAADHELNLLRMLAHSPPVLRGFQGLGAALLGDLSLSPRLREVAILRTGMLAGATYEVAKHLEIARWVGLGDEDLAALRPGGSLKALDAPALAVVRLADELHAGARASDSAFRELGKHLNEREIVEVVSTIGFYGMVCRILETLAVDMEEAAGAR